MQSHHPHHRFHHRARRAGTAALAALALTAWIAPAMAQQAPPAAPPGQEAPRGPMGGAMGGPMGGPGGHMGGHGGGMHHGHHHGMRGPFGGLFFPREDKALTVAEVQKIAEAFLLWQGERNWRVTEVKEAANNTVEFALSTPEGSVVARFSVDRKTGRPRRIG